MRHASVYFCLSAVTSTEWTAAGMIHKSRGVTHSHCHLTRTFLSITCVWIPRSWHTTTPTEMSLWRCWWLTYTEMKSTKYLGRKWQPALPSHITLLKQVQDYKWMNRGRLSVSISNLASFSNFFQGHRKKTDWKPQTGTRSCDKIGYSHLRVHLLLWRSVQLFD